MGPLLLTLIILLVLYQQSITTIIIIIIITTTTIIVVIVIVIVIIIVVVIFILPWHVPFILTNPCLSLQSHLKLPGKLKHFSPGELLQVVAFSAHSSISEKNKDLLEQSQNHALTILLYTCIEHFLRQVNIQLIKYLVFV